MSLAERAAPEPRGPPSFQAGGKIPWVDWLLTDAMQRRGMTTDDRLLAIETNIAMQRFLLRSLMASFLSGLPEAEREAFLDQLSSPAIELQPPEGADQEDQRRVAKLYDKLILDFAAGVRATMASG